MGTVNASKKKKVYEAEQILRDEGYVTFHRGNAHGLFHVLGIKHGTTKLVQIVRLHKRSYNEINKNLVKVQDFVMGEHFNKSRMDAEVWVWVNHKGWVKYYFEQDGSFIEYEDYGDNNYRKGTPNMVRK